jgi:methylmalonyl-CoA mutase N-terminal domain/subunit
MYRSRLWTMRQYGGFGTARETNRRFRLLLEAGQTGLSVAFDLPTQIGYDPDHPLADGEVGRAGVSIATIDDVEELFDSIPLERVSVSMTINSTAAILLAFMIALAKRRGLDPAKLQGTVQNDILKEFIARGTYRFPVKPSLRIVADVVEHCERNLPLWNTISISGYHVREAGSTAAQEIAFTLANGIAYVEAARVRGLPVDRFARRLSFFFNAHNHFFEEVAKFRAARRLWATILRERFGAQDPDAMRLRFHAQTAGSTLTSRQPEVNVVRVALQALAAVLGGTQSLHTNSYDEALALPTEDAAKLALRTQQVIGAESGVADTIDPLGGAPYVEALTDGLEARARVLLAEIDRLGGAVAAIEKGFPQAEIARAAYAAQKAIESGERSVVGVNVHAGPDARTRRIFRLDPRVQRSRVAAMRRARKARDASAVESARATLAESARSGANLMPPLVNAVEARATLGEICDTLEGVFGRAKPPRG